MDFPQGGSTSMWRGLLRAISLRGPSVLPTRPGLIMGFVSASAVIPGESSRRTLRSETPPAVISTTSSSWATRFMPTYPRRRFPFRRPRLQAFWASTAPPSSNVAPRSKYRDRRLWLDGARRRCREPGTHRDGIRHRALHRERPGQDPEGVLGRRPSVVSRFVVLPK